MSVEPDLYPVICLIFQPRTGEAKRKNFSTAENQINTVMPGYESAVELYNIRFPVDSSQIPEEAVYFSPGCRMTRSPIAPWHPQPYWPFYQRHPVVIAKR